jgi:hypothetical protein
MNAEQIIADIEWLEHLFSLPDNRTLQTADRLEDGAAGG